MQTWWEKNFANCQLGDQRLTRRALSIGQAVSEGFGQALSSIFNSAGDLKRAYDFFQILKRALNTSLLLIAA